MFERGIAKAASDVLRKMKQMLELLKGMDPEVRPIHEKSVIALENLAQATGKLAGRTADLVDAARRTHEAVDPRALEALKTGRRLAEQAMVLPDGPARDALTRQAQEAMERIAAELEIGPLTFELAKEHKRIIDELGEEISAAIDDSEDHYRKEAAKDGGVILGRYLAARIPGAAVVLDTIELLGAVRDILRRRQQDWKSTSDLLKRERIFRESLDEITVKVREAEKLVDQHMTELKPYLK